jgi:hypothetical protein
MLLSNIQWFLELSVTDFSLQPTQCQTSDDPPFQCALLYEALKDLNTYFLGRHLPKDWNATAMSWWHHFWIFACLLHQIVALFDHWWKQDIIVQPIVPAQAPGQTLASLSPLLYCSHSRCSTSLLHEVMCWRREAQDIFGGYQFTSHHLIQQEPTAIFFDGPPPPEYPPPSHSMHQPSYH